MHVLVLVFTIYFIAAVTNHFKMSGMQVIPLQVAPGITDLFAYLGLYTDR